MLLGLLRAIVVSRARARRVNEIVSDGIKVPGVVTEVLPTGTEINGMPYLRFTVKFADHNRVERWVEKKGTFPHTALPRAGDPVQVWYDPQDPANTQRIIIGLGPEAL